MQQVQMAEDIDFKYPMRKSCAWEISSFCKDVPHGRARIIRCLQVCAAKGNVHGRCHAMCAPLAP